MADQQPKPSHLRHCDPTSALFMIGLWLVTPHSCSGLPELFQPNGLADGSRSVGAPRRPPDQRPLLRPTTPAGSQMHHRRPPPRRQRIHPCRGRRPQIRWPGLKRVPRAQAQENCSQKHPEPCMGDTTALSARPAPESGASSNACPPRMPGLTLTVKPLPVPNPK